MRASGGGGGGTGGGRSFPALGFDPAEGDRSAVATVLMSLQEAGIQLEEVSSRLTEALDVSDDWSGDAADDFHDYGDDLPKALDSGAESMKAVAQALSTWASQLVANQALADELERQAKKLKAQLNATESCDDRWTTLNTALRKVLEDARRLQARHLRQANAAADAIRRGPDDAFEPENDGWFVQILDGVSKVSGIASAVTGIAAAGLAVTGVGLPVAGVLEGVSGATAGLNLATGLAQRAAGSGNAPSNLDLALSAFPAKTVTSGAIGAVKGAARPVIGASRLRTGARGAAAGAADGFTSGGYPALVGKLRDFQRTASRIGLRNALRSTAATDGVVLALTEQNKLAGKALVNTVDATVKTIEASGVELTPAQKREIEALKLAADPSREQLEDGVVNTVTDKLKGR